MAPAQSKVANPPSLVFRSGEEDNDASTAHLTQGKIVWDPKPNPLCGRKCRFFLRDDTGEWKLVFIAVRNGARNNFTISSVNKNEKILRNVGRVAVVSDDVVEPDLSYIGVDELKKLAKLNSSNESQYLIALLHFLTYRITKFDKKKEQPVGWVNQDFMALTKDKGFLPWLFEGYYDPFKIQLEPSMRIAAGTVAKNNNTVKLCYEPVSETGVPATKSVTSAKMVMNTGSGRKTCLLLRPGSDENSLRVDFDEPFNAFRAFAAAIAQGMSHDYLWNLTCIKRSSSMNKMIFHAIFVFFFSLFYLYVHIEYVKLLRNTNIRPQY